MLHLIIKLSHTMKTVLSRVTLESLIIRAYLRMEIT